eukprot:GHVH01008847.1.p1 GENE.GHVH01008847.1~~GHVH01008847.1.p1  ORF type:complete len:164 (-),score=35.32 GHVH01008847.1:21-512(-)
MKEFDEEELHALIDDLETDLKTLEDLPKKTCHECLIPFGRSAFFKGILTNTNEPLQSLSLNNDGEVWVRRSAYQAKAMISRHLVEAKQQATRFQDVDEVDHQPSKTHGDEGTRWNEDGYLEIVEKEEDEEPAVARLVKERTEDRPAIPAEKVMSVFKQRMMEK